MRIEELWKTIEMDAKAGKTGASGWLLRLGRPTTNFPLFVGLELASRRRAVLLRLRTELLPARRLWPRSKGLEPLAVEIDGAVHFGVALKEPRFAEVFSALSEDLIRRVSIADSENAQAREFLGQLGRWQKFLAVAVEGLSDESQRGLWAELHFLQTELLPRCEATTAIAAWQGPKGAAQDFLLPVGAVEIKATMSKRPYLVPISSERQLDDHGLPALYLRHYALALREGIGTSLPAFVNEFRVQLAGNPAAGEAFEEALLAAGYLDVHAPRYENLGYSVREVRDFVVRRGFPRVTERDLPNGLGNVRYVLALAACESFAIPPGWLIEKLTKGCLHKRHRPKS